jgi:hypothetical protein
MRNFILQQGFEEPASAVCPRHYSALHFQPRIVLVWVVAGILFQTHQRFRPSALFCGGALCFRNSIPSRLCTIRRLAAEPAPFTLLPPRRHVGWRKR